MANHSIKKKTDGKNCKQYSCVFQRLNKLVEDKDVLFGFVVFGGSILFVLIYGGYAIIKEFFN